MREKLERTLLINLFRFVFFFASFHKIAALKKKKKKKKERKQLNKKTI